MHFLIDYLSIILFVLPVFVSYVSRLLFFDICVCSLCSYYSRPHFCWLSCSCIIVIMTLLLTPTSIGAFWVLITESRTYIPIHLWCAASLCPSDTTHTSRPCWLNGWGSPVGQHSRMRRNPAVPLHSTDLRMLIAIVSRRWDCEYFRNRSAVDWYWERQACLRQQFWWSLLEGQKTQCPDTASYGPYSTQYQGLTPWLFMPLLLLFCSPVPFFFFNSFWHTSFLNSRVNVWRHDVCTRPSHVRLPFHFISCSMKIR